VPLLSQGQAIGLDLMARPTLLIPVPSSSAARVLVGGQGILAGAVFRESGTALTAQAFTTASQQSVVAAALNPALPGGAGLTTWVTGFEVTGLGATAAISVLVTLTGAIGGTLNYDIAVPAGATTSIVPLIVDLPPPGIPASGVNTAITLNVPTFGAGNVAVAASIRGYQQAVGSALGSGLATPVVIADLLDGTDATGELLAPLDLPPFGLYSAGLGPHGPIFTRGLFLNVTAGTLRGAVYVKI
jgi:hypothetical protein